MTTTSQPKSSTTTARNIRKPLITSLQKLTFVTSWDDGSEQDLLIAELLEKYSISGTFFIIIDRVGTKGYLTWKQIRALDENPLFTIGSHTMSHPMDMKLLYAEDLFYEVQNSKDLLEAVLGHTVTQFCYPRGRHNDTVRQRVRESGYLSARTTIVGKDTIGDDVFQMPTTAHVYDGRPEYKQKKWLTFAKEQLEAMLKNPEEKVFHLWGHADEVIKHEQVACLQEFLEYVCTKCIPMPMEGA